MSRPFQERWGDMRDNCDQALKLAGMLPSAVRTAQDDPDFIEQVMVHKPDGSTVAQLERITRNGGRTDG